METIEIVTSPSRAASLVTHPLRPRILASALEPVSASELARRLGQPRQRINYHVRQLASEGLLQPAGQQRKRNMVEQQYVASARSYLLTPDVLGEAAPATDPMRDSSSAADLFALCAQAQRDVAQLIAAASAAGVRARTMAMLTDVRFENAVQRAEFTNELMNAISDVVSRYTTGSTSAAEPPASGRPFRLVVGCYPIPGDAIRPATGT